MTTRGTACTPLTEEVTQHRNVSGDDGLDRCSVKAASHLSTAARTSSTVIRKQFHVAAVAIFLPGLLMDVNILRMAVSCSLVVLVLFEVCASAHEMSIVETSLRCVN